MKYYLVVWQSDGPVIQSKVMFNGDVTNVTEEYWVKVAAASEGYNLEEIDAIIETGYSLFLVIDYPTHFYV